MHLKMQSRLNDLSPHYFSYMSVNPIPPGKYTYDHPDSVSRDKALGNRVNANAEMGSKMCFVVVKAI